MNEQKNNLEQINPENLDYSFDFANQVEPEQTTEAPVVETVATESTPVMPEQPQMVDVSVPVMEQNVSETPVTEVQETVAVEQTQPTEQTAEEIKDGKSTLRFVIILVVIIVAFIIALPFVLNWLGY